MDRIVPTEPATANSYRTCDSKFSDRAAAAYQAFSSFLLGRLLREVPAHGADICPVKNPDPTPADIHDLDGYPLLQALKPLLCEDRSAEVFSSFPELLIRDIRALRKT